MQGAYLYDVMDDGIYVLRPVVQKPVRLARSFKTNIQIKLSNCLLMKLVMFSQIFFGSKELLHVFFKVLKQTVLLKCINKNTRLKFNPELEL